MQASSPDKGLEPAFETIEPDICVIGSGAGGMAAALEAAAFGRSVCLIEKQRMGGSALNYGCLPSMAFLAAAERAELIRTSRPFGIEAQEPKIDPRAVCHHVQDIIATETANHTIERLTGFGIRVIFGAARFLDRRTLIAGDTRIKARRVIIATGSAPLVPDIPGIDAIPFFTPETIFANDRRLAHLLIWGSGSTALELADAHRRLGSDVTVIAPDRALPDEDPEMAAVVLRALAARGINIRQATKLERFEARAGGFRVAVSDANFQEVLDATHLLIAGPREPNIDDLNLDAAGIKHEARGIKVNAGLRTTNRRVYAIGAASGSGDQTNIATAQASIVLKRALFLVPARFRPEIIPRVIKTDPALAHVGLTEAQALDRGYKVDVLRWPFEENDRARAERRTTGHVKIIAEKSGRILGATISAANAEHLIDVWSLALAKGLTMTDMAAWTPAHPALGEASKKAATRFFAAMTAKPSVRRMIGYVAKLG